jgi:hypothetical protein
MPLRIKKMHKLQEFRVFDVMLHWVSPSPRSGRPPPPSSLHLKNAVTNGLLQLHAVSFSWHLGSCSLKLYPGLFSSGRAHSHGASPRSMWSWWAFRVMSPGLFISSRFGFPVVRRTCLEYFGIHWVLHRRAWVFLGAVSLTEIHFNKAGIRLNAIR